MSETDANGIEIRLREVVESSPSGLLMIDARGTIVLVNREVERLFGYSREELLGASIEKLVPHRFRDDHPGFRASFAMDPRARAMGAGRDLFGLRNDGVEVPVEIGLRPVATPEGLFVISSIVDISARKAAEEERRRLEEQLRQSQKMEAVGRLAGGVAHDFNNILASILGYAELVGEEIREPAQRTDLEEILRAARRGKEIVERILRFGRRQALELRLVDLMQVLGDAERLLRATLPATIEVSLQGPPAPLRILADATSMQQVVVNLAVNAADAMPSGGRVEILAEATYVRDHVARRHPELREGPHALIQVRDSGHGMDAATLARAMEPFFTTKPTGKGTGLGLSIVHGIVRDHGGVLWLESRPDEGTVVRLLVPSPESEDDAEREWSPESPPRGQGERVLVVDDEAALAALGRRRLAALGYRATAVESPLAALELLREGPGAFDLLISDYSMPGLTGLELAAAARALDPGLRILLLTGYTETFSEAEASRFVDRIERKPIPARELAVAVRALLERPESGRAERRRGEDAGLDGGSR